MSGLKCKLSTSVLIQTGTAKKTLLQIAAPANQGIVIDGASFTPQGVVSTDRGIQVWLMGQTSAGSMITRSPEKKHNFRTEVIQSVGQENSVGSEPAYGAVLAGPFIVHPQAGMVAEFDFDEILVGGNGRVALVVESDVDVPCHAYIDFNE